MIFTAAPVRLAPNGGSLYRLSTGYSSFSSPNIQLLGYHITFSPFVNRIFPVFPRKIQTFRSNRFPRKNRPRPRGRPGRGTGEITSRRSFRRNEPGSQRPVPGLPSPWETASHCGAADQAAAHSPLQSRHRILANALEILVAQQIASLPTLMSAPLAWRAKGV